MPKEVPDNFILINPILDFFSYSSLTLPHGCLIILEIHKLPISSEIIKRLNEMP